MRQIISVREVEEWGIKHCIDHGHVRLILRFLLEMEKQTIYNFGQFTANKLHIYSML